VHYNQKHVMTFAAYVVPKSLSQAGRPRLSWGTTGKRQFRSFEIDYRNPRGVEFEHTSSFVDAALLSYRGAAIQLSWLKSTANMGQKGNAFLTCSAPRHSGRVLAYAP
jgi:hypothetical protein